MNDETQLLILDKVEFPWPKSSGWLKANLDQIGFYRVNYDAENWEALAGQLMKDHTVSNLECFHYLLYSAWLFITPDR